MSGGAHDFARVVDVADNLSDWEDALNEALGEADMYDERDAFYDRRISLRELRAIAFTKMVRAEDGVYGDITLKIGEDVEKACKRILAEHWEAYPPKAAEDEEGEE